MYRNCVYNSKTSTITEFTWDEDGNRVSLESNFKPIVFLETSKKTKYKSVYGTNLEPKVFDNSGSKWKFMDNYDGRVFYDISAEQQYLISKYRNSPKDDFTKYDLRTFYLDIECPSDSGFPEASSASYEIDLISCYDSLAGKYLMWGKHPYSGDNIVEETRNLGGELIEIDENDVIYYEIFDEKERLTHFLKYWVDNTPDIFTHWNGRTFDTPYIVNRMKLILPKNAYKKLSPTGRVLPKETKDKFNNPITIYEIEGVSCMDYMEVFGYFRNNEERESWKLDDVCQEQLGCGKIEYESDNLYQLSRSDWDKYAVYNLVDILLLTSLEKKLRYLKIARSLSHKGFGNPQDTLGKVKVLSGVVALTGLKHGVFVHTDRRKEKGDVEGGFVRKAFMTFSKNVYTFDFTSLYPTTIMTFNISHENKVGRIINEDDGKYTLVFFDERESIRFFDKSGYDQWLKDNNCCVSFHNIVFSQDKLGIIPLAVEEIFNEKQYYDGLKSKAISDNDYVSARDFEDQRQIYKTLANSLYGILATASSPYYDTDLANSITISGQQVIKHSADKFHEYCIDKFGVTKDPVVAGDTDSIMCDLTEVFDKLGKKVVNDDMTLSETGHQVSILFEKFLNHTTKLLADSRNCSNNAFNIGREKVATTSIFFAKKQYAYHVVNDEGDDLPEHKRMKYTGLKVVKSEYSPLAKEIFGDMYRQVLTKVLDGESECRSELVKILKDGRKKFFDGSFYDVSKRQRSNNIDKYQSKYLDEFDAGKSGAQAHIKGVINYNTLINKFNLESKYPPLTSGNKVMWCYVKPNVYGINSIAGYNGNVPEEFGLEIDYERQFETLMMKAITQLFECLGWNMPSLHVDEKFDIDELFS